MTFRITIINNETGKTVIDQDTDAIICAVDNGETVLGGSYINCNKNDLANLLEVVLATAGRSMNANLSRKTTREIIRCAKKKAQA